MYSEPLRIEYLKTFSTTSTNKKRLSLSYETVSFFVSTHHTERNHYLDNTNIEMVAYSNEPDRHHFLLLQKTFPLKRLDLAIKVKVVGNTAISTFKMTVTNTLEGKLSLPLNGDQDICR